MRSIALGGSALFMLVLACTASADSQEQAGASAQSVPNVVIFFTDDQGYGDLSCYGHPTIHTPHVDRLVREGARLTQFYVASPVCSPSRAALLTGCYPKRVGMQKHVIFPNYDYGLHGDEVTLADLLKSRGYATGVFGKWHLGHRPGLLPLDQGFDTYFGVPYSNDMAQFHRKAGTKYDFHLPLIQDQRVIEWEPDQRFLTRRCTQAALEFIDRVHGEPFFLYMPFSMPHIPIYTSEEFDGVSSRGLYGDVIEEIDWSVGQVLDRLDSHGVADNTLVVFTSDNGPWLSFRERGGSAGPLRGGKGSNWEGGQRVPCAMRWPGVIPAGSVRRELLATMDILPTLAAVTGAQLPEGRVVDGHNILSILRGSGSTAFDHRQRPFLYYSSQGKLAGVRRGPWKLMLPMYSKLGSVLKMELYNVETDISEKWDRAKENPELVKELAELASTLDAEIEANARPVERVQALLFDPAKPENPDGTAFEMTNERRRPQ